MSKPLNICAERRPTRRIVLHDPRGVETAIGDGAPIRVQSMTTTVTGDLAATAAQVMELASAGAELVRVTVNDDAAADVLPDLVKMSNVPIVADIHYQHDLALRSIEAGIAKLRINPGNIGSRDKVELVVKAARDAGIPIRVGVNKGSLHRRYEEMATTDPAGAMVQSAVDELEVFEKLNYRDVLVSLKSSEPMEVVEACRRFAKLSDVPQHLGVTEAGTLAAGIARSATAMGVLLSEGIGDTVRISLADDPVHEVNAAFHMLQALGLREGKARVVACPTCGRVEVDIVALATKVEELAKDLPGDRVISVLGCIVNGPGEAKAADLGIAAGRTKVAIYRKGELVRQVSKDELDVVLAEEIELLR